MISKELRYILGILRLGSECNILIFISIKFEERLFPIFAVIILSFGFLAKVREDSLSPMHVEMNNVIWPFAIEISFALFEMCL